MPFRTGRKGTVTLAKISGYLLFAGFSVMFSNFVGGFLTYFSSRLDIADSTLTLIKWIGLLNGVAGFIILRLIANCFGHHFINVGISAGGAFSF